MSVLLASSQGRHNTLQLLPLGLWWPPSPIPPNTGIQLFLLQSPSRKRAGKGHHRGALPEDPNFVAEYIDFREMLEKESALDAVLRTPDHTHAFVAANSMRAGKHVCREAVGS